MNAPMDDETAKRLINPALDAYARNIAGIGPPGQAVPADVLQRLETLERLVKELTERIAALEQRP